MTLEAVKDPEVRVLTVTEMRVANPDILGLWAFAIGTFLGNITGTGLIVGGGLGIATAILIAGVAQLVAGLQEYRARKVFGSTSFTAFGLFWITIGVDQWMEREHLFSQTPNAFAGFYLLLWALFAMMLHGATFVLNRALNLMVGLSWIGLLFKSIGAFVNSAAWTEAGSWVLVVSAAVAIYVGAAQFWNSAFHRVVLPLGEVQKKASVIQV